MTNKIKVLILINNLFHYRVPIFNILAEKCDLTICYSIGQYEIDKEKFKVLKLPIIKWGKFAIHKNNIFKFCQKYDAIIALGDIAWLNISFLPFWKKRKYKIIFWTIGVSASYKKKYDNIKYWDCVRDYFYKKADALVFYSDYPINKYIKRGFIKERLFVAPNTVDVCFDVNWKEIKKDSLLFIGTLYREKGIMALLENYKSAYKENSNVLPINIIGGGDEYEAVNNWIIDSELSDKIILLGAIYNNKKKSIYFKRAYACISPYQAGLSVLESMGYGVPFITMQNAITGGERFNIKNNINGILIKKEAEIKDIIVDISQNPEKYIQMGIRAREYYNDSHKPEDMAKGLYSAIEYVTK